jgi:8-oxo-dGTP pyrophosphatase MutT (NUDIX family)
MSRYSMGFVISPDGQSILLLEKNRPAILAGTWMGLAGHIEPGETPLEAVIRESAEEGDVHYVQWQYIKQLEGPEVADAEIHVYVGTADLSTARALTDERIQVFTWEQLEALPLGHSTVEVLDQLKAYAATLSRCACASSSNAPRSRARP